MGLFYQNVTVKGPTPTQLLAYLRQWERSAWLSPTTDGVTTIFDDDMSRNRNVSRRFEAPARYRPGLTGWEPFVRELSAHFHCVLWVAEVYDGDYFYYQLYDEGVLIDEYISDDDPFGNADEMVADTTLLRENDHAAALCAAFGALGARDAVAAILDAPGDERPESVHQAVIHALGLSDHAWSGRPTAFANREISGGYVSTLWHPVDPPRPLDAWERGLIERILAPPVDRPDEPPGVREVHGQLGSAMVFEESSRNLSIGIRVAHDPATQVPGAHSGSFLALVGGTDSDGMGIWAIIDLAEGYLSALTVRRADTMAFKARPPLEQFR